jgi:hypothetical protein
LFYTFLLNPPPPYQFPLLNLRFLIFGSTPFDWLPSVTLSSFDGNIFFDLSPIFQKNDYGVKQGLGVQVRSLATLRTLLD